MWKLLSVIVTGIALSLCFPGTTYVAVAQGCDVCAQSAGKITGRVLTAEGAPVSRANVYAVRHNFESGVIPTTQTNSNGYFNLIVPAALYTVYSGKISEGYPEDVADIYKNLVQCVDVQVRVDQVVDGIELRVGPQLGKLFGEVVAFSTGQSIPEGYVLIRLVSNPDVSLRISIAGDGRFNLLVPSEPFTLEVSSPKYETWRYRNDDVKNNAEQLEIFGAESKRLRIALRPKRVVK